MTHRLRRFCLLAWALGIATFANAASAAVISDFEDGTLQGWTLVDPGGSLLEVTPNGNPGFAITSTDTASGLSIQIAGPASYTGDLRTFTQIRLDELVFSDANPIQGAQVVLVGSDGTRWRTADRSLIAVDSWVTRTIPLDESLWELPGGSGLSFGQVLENVVEFRLDLDTSSSPTAVEISLDNIQLVPEPSTGLLLGAGLAGLAAASRRRRPGREASGVRVSAERFELPTPSV